MGVTDLYLGERGGGGERSGRQSSVESVVKLETQTRCPGGSPNPEEHYPLKHTCSYNTPVAIISV